MDDKDREAINSIDSWKYHTLPIYLKSSCFICERTIHPTFTCWYTNEEHNRNACNYCYTVYTQLIKAEKQKKDKIQKLPCGLCENGNKNGNLMVLCHKCAENPIISKEDPINHPQHYTSHPSGIEAIEITQYEDFLTGNALKYILRHKLKGKPVEDLEKAIWYLKRRIEILKANGDKENGV